MRRVLPWALLSLVAVAGLVGALVGVANRAVAPPATSPKCLAIVAATLFSGNGPLPLTRRWPPAEIHYSAQCRLGGEQSISEPVQWPLSSGAPDRNMKKDGNDAISSGHSDDGR